MKLQVRGRLWGRGGGEGGWRGLPLSSRNRKRLRPGPASAWGNFLGAPQAAVAASVPLMSAEKADPGTLPSSKGSSSASDKLRLAPSSPASWFPAPGPWAGEGAHSTEGASGLGTCHGEGPAGVQEPVRSKEQGCRLPTHISGTTTRVSSAHHRPCTCLLLTLCPPLPRSGTRPGRSGSAVSPTLTTEMPKVRPWCAPAPSPTHRGRGGGAPFCPRAPVTSLSPCSLAPAV